MNLLDVSQLIQDGYREYYKQPIIVRPILNATKEDYVLCYVMKKSKGHLNPSVISGLIELETSIPDQNGMVAC